MKCRDIDLWKHYRIWYSNADEKMAKLLQMFPLYRKAYATPEIYCSAASSVLSLAEHLSCHDIRSVRTFESLETRMHRVLSGNHLIGIENAPACFLGIDTDRFEISMGQVHHVVHYDLPESQQSCYERNHQNFGVGVAYYFIPESNLGRAQMSFVEGYYRGIAEDWPLTCAEELK